LYCLSTSHPHTIYISTLSLHDALPISSAIVAAHEQPGDVVFYLPATMHVLGTGYPAPFSRLRDIARNKSAVASATLTGTEITSRSEEHTSELQSLAYLVCRLLLEKKKT